jgi:hypothetical protein
VVDFTVECEWLGRVTAAIRARFCPGVKRGRGSAGKWVANAHKNAILALRTKGNFENVETNVQLALPSVGLGALPCGCRKPCSGC